MNPLTVKNLCKNYPSFSLKDVSFTLEEGKITGFIGRNGAGKTTTLKSLLNFVHPDSGEICFFNQSFKDSELNIKEQLGFVSGGLKFYSTKRLKTITAVTKSFYQNWDEAAYAHYMKLFKLEASKTPAQLSEGMKVKYALALALSHHAKLLILDEPTSGLDPISRDELLDIFLELVAQGITILFSTHITSDLDKCADNIIYIKDGHILADMAMDTFTSTYKLLEFTPSQLEALTPDIASRLIGQKRDKAGYSALILAANLPAIDATVKTADLETIMIHLEKEEN